MKTLTLILLCLFALVGCEYLGAFSNNGTIARLKYVNGECGVELWQGEVTLPDAESFSISENVLIDSECALNLEYNETEKADE